MAPLCLVSGFKVDSKTAPKMVGLMALSDHGAPSYDERSAKKLAWSKKNLKPPPLQLPFAKNIKLP